MLYLLPLRARSSSLGSIGLGGKCRLPSVPRAHTPATPSLPNHFFFDLQSLASSADPDSPATFDVCLEVYLESIRSSVGSSVAGGGVVQYVTQRPSAPMAQPRKFRVNAPSSVAGGRDDDGDDEEEEGGVVGRVLRRYLLGWLANTRRSG